MNEENPFKKYLGNDFEQVTPQAPLPNKQPEELTNRSESIPDEKRLKAKEELVKLGFTHLDFIDSLNEVELTELLDIIETQDQSQESSGVSVEEKRSKILSALDKVLPVNTLENTLQEEAESYLTTTLIDNRMDARKVSKYIKDYFTDRDLQGFVTRYTKEVTPEVNTLELLTSDPNQVESKLTEIKEQLKSNMAGSFMSEANLKVTVIRNYEKEDAKTEGIEDEVVRLHGLIKDAQEVLKNKGFPSEDPLEPISSKLRTYASLMDGLDIINPQTPQEWIADIRRTVDSIPDAISQVVRTDDDLFPQEYKQDFKDAMIPVQGVLEDLDSAISAYNIKIETINETPLQNPAQEFTRVFPELPPNAFEAFERFLKSSIFKHTRANAINSVRTKIQTAAGELEEHKPIFKSATTLQDKVKELQEKYIEQPKHQSTEVVNPLDLNEAETKAELSRIDSRFTKLRELSSDLSQLRNGYLVLEILKETDSEELRKRKEHLNFLIDVLKRLKEATQPTKETPIVTPVESHLPAQDQSILATQVNQNITSTSVVEPETEVETTQVEKNPLETALENLAPKLEIVPLTTLGDNEFMVEANEKKGVRISKGNGAYMVQIQDAIYSTITDSFTIESTAANIRLGKDKQVELKEGSTLMVAGIYPTALFSIFLVIDDKPVLISLPDQNSTNEFYLLARRNSQNQKNFLAALKSVVKLIPPKK